MSTAFSLVGKVTAAAAATATTTTTTTNNNNNNNKTHKYINFMINLVAVFGDISF